MPGGWSGGWSLCERSIPGNPARNQIELVDLIHNRYEIGTEPSLVRGSAATQIRQQEAQMRQEQASGQLHSAGLTSVEGHRVLRLVTTGSPGLQYLVDPHSYLLLEFISPGTSRVATLHGRRVNVTGPDFVEHYEYLAPTAANAALLWQAPPKGATRLAFPPCKTFGQCDANILAFQLQAVVGLRPPPAAAKPHQLGPAHR
ncbi:MAG: hypothetical protein ACRDY2_10605 [Acidimicrobiales bacterium]